MEAQWLTGSFSNWQIFNNNPGYANTNSNIESFNSTFKRVYTNYFKCSMYVACLKIFDCIGDYSNKADERNHFHESPEYDESVRKYADNIAKTSFKKTGL